MRLVNVALLRCASLCVTALGRALSRSVYSRVTLFCYALIGVCVCARAFPNWRLLSRARFGITIFAFTIGAVGQDDVI